MTPRFAAVAIAIVAAGFACSAAAEELQPHQQRFVVINDAMAAAFAGVTNPKIDSMISALDRRSKALCQVAPGGVAAGWQAVVASVSEDGGTVELLASPTARLRVSNLEAMDLDYVPAAGDMVRISGKFDMEDDHCFRQIAELTGNALANPVYEFTLTAISVIAAPAETAL